MLFLCVNVYCHRVTTQLQLINIIIIITVFFFEIRTLHEVPCRNTLEPDRPQMKIRRMCIECWTSKATNTHRDYVTILAFPQNDGYTNAPQC